MPSTIRLYIYDYGCSSLSGDICVELSLSMIRSFGFMRMELTTIMLYCNETISTLEKLIAFTVVNSFVIQTRFMLKLLENSSGHERYRITV